MGIFSKLNPVKIVKKAVGVVKKQVSNVAKVVKKSVKAVGKVAEKVVKGVAKGVREVGRGVKKLARNKYVRMGLMITAAVMLPGAIAALPALSGLGATAAAVATGAITGAVTGAGSTLLAGGNLKDALKTGALGAATGAAFARIGQAIKGAQVKESLDLTQGKLDAMGADLADVSATSTSPTISLDGSPTIDTSTLPRDALGQVDLKQLTTTDGAFRATSPLDVSKGLDISSDVLKDPSSFTNVPELKLTARGTREVLSSPTGMSEQVAQSLQDFKIDTSALTDAQRQAIGLPPKISATDINLPEPQSFGDRFKDSVKDAFSPENIVDKGLSIGEDLLVGAARGAISERMADDQYVGDPAYAQQEYANQLQQFQIAYQNAGININDAYANMTYGSGDVNAVGGELFRQQTIQVA